MPARKSEFAEAVETVELLPSRARTANGGEKLDIESLLRAKGCLNKAVDTLIACLDAERTYYDVFSKQMIKEPCYATRLGAAKTLIANEIGEPVKRQQIMVYQIDSNEDLKAKLAGSPALCESLAKMLQEAQESKKAPQ